jgi:hypothetical protein
MPDRMRNAVLESQTMSETLVETFELFFVDLPATVRNDLSFMMVTLMDEDLLIVEVEDVYEAAAHGLFKANTRIGRIGKLIHAASVFDVYFAMDVRERFGPRKAAPKRGPERNGAPASCLDHYAGEIAAIEAAKRRWRELRATILSPAAIATALIPARSPQGTARQFSVPSAHDGNL